MKVEVKNLNYRYITDDSRIIDEEGAFLVTEHNKDFQGEAEKRGCSFFLKPSELFRE